MAHGVAFTPLSFTVHDYIHRNLDPRPKALKQFILNELAAQVEQGHSLDFAAPILVEQALQRYQLLNEGLNHLFNYYIIHLNMHHDEGTFKKAMAGFFWVMRERTQIVPDIYKTGDFAQVLKFLAGDDFITAEEGKSDRNGSQKLKIDPESWAASYDLYATSPLTGETALTDEEIANKTLELLRSTNPETDLFISPDQMEAKHTYSIKMTKRFIDIMLKANHGLNSSLSVPTLYHKWLTLDDSRALLKYAGINIEKPSLDSKKEREARFMALATLESVEKAIKELVTNFAESSINLASINWLEGFNANLQDHYRARFEELESGYNAKLTCLNSRFRKSKITI